MEQRRNDIVSFVNENGSVTFAQIKERFAGVSEMTLRTVKGSRSTKPNHSNSWWSKIIGSSYEK